jgi:phage shock protein A
MWQSFLNWFGGKARPDASPQQVLALALRQVEAAVARVQRAQAQADARQAEVQATLQAAEAQLAKLWEEAKQAHRKGSAPLATAKMQAKTEAEAKVARLRQLRDEAGAHAQALRQQLGQLQLQAEELKNKEAMLTTRLASAETLADLHQKLAQLGASEQVEALEDAVNRAETFSQLLHQELGLPVDSSDLAAELRREEEQERQKAEAEHLERIGKLFAENPEKLAQYQQRLAQQQSADQQAHIEAFFAQGRPKTGPEADGPAPELPDLADEVARFFATNQSAQKKLDDFFDQ